MPRDYQYDISGGDITFTFPHVGLLIGKPRSGKSVMINYLVHQLAVDQKPLNASVNETTINTKTGPAWDYIVVCSPTVHQNPDYNWLDDKYKKTEFTAELITDLLATQAANNSPRCLLILDDAVGNKNMDSMVMRRLMTTYRHWNISVWIAVQYLNIAVPTVIRACTTYAMWARIRSKRGIKALLDGFAEEFGDDEFVELNRRMPKNVFVLFSALADKPSEEYRLIKAPFPIPTFHLADDEDEQEANDKRKRDEEDEGGAAMEKEVPQSAAQIKKSKIRKRMAPAAELSLITGAAPASNQQQNASSSGPAPSSRGTGLSLFSNDAAAEGYVDSFSRGEMPASTPGVQINIKKEIKKEKYE